MSINLDDRLPDVLETLLQAESEFVRLLLEAAPLPEGSTKDPKYFELMIRYDRYMPSAEVWSIARLFYMLGAYGVTDGEAMRRLAVAHNERMATLAADAAYLSRMRIQKGKLLQARFKAGAVDHSATNFTLHGGVALDASAIGRLLVEFSPKTQLSDAMDLLASLGFFRTASASYGAKVFLSDGRLEALYAGYLAQVRQGAAAACRPVLATTRKGQGHGRAA